MLPLATSSHNRFLIATDAVDKATALRTWLKRGKLAQSDFNYFRGIAKEFYRQWAEHDLPKSPLVWSCGDVHVKNVGTYRGDNGIAYFDLDDFDEACLTPLHFDLGRAAAGLFLMHGASLTERFISAFVAALADGKPYHIEPECSEGPAKLLLDRVEGRSRKAFLKKWVDDGKICEVPEETYRLPALVRKRAQTIFEGWAQLKTDAKYFRVLDVCGSTAGIGSLSGERYLVLVRGNKRPHILDMKEATPSSMAGAHKVVQPKWRNEAQRIVEVQRFMQYMPIARLGWTDTSPVSFVITEFQPAEDRMDSLDLSEKEYVKFVQQWACLVAWGHLRAAGWRGSPPTDALIKFGRELSPALQRRILSLAVAAAKEISRAHRLYSEAVLPEAP